MVEGTGICSAGIEAGGGMSRSNISQHHHKKHTQFMEMKNMKLRTSRNLPNHSVLLLSVRLDDSTPNISIIWASIILLTVTVTVSNKM